MLGKCAADCARHSQRKTTGSSSIWQVAVFTLAILVVPLSWVVPGWRILRRTGHSGAWALPGFVPMPGPFPLWIVAFSEWPAERERPAGLGARERRGVRPTRRPAERPANSHIAHSIV